MVSKSFVGGLFSRAAYLMPIQVEPRADGGSYKANTVDALQALQEWYDDETGLWNTTGWWNSANCLTVLADFAALDDDNVVGSGLNIPEIIQTTYEQAQKTTVQVQKSLSAAGLPTSSYTRVSKRANIVKRGFENFLDDYYDDEGWWALALIHSHDVGVQGLGDQQYLQAANTIFEDMKSGSSPCGGIYWSKVTNYTNAIANELYLSVAASLANRMPNKQYYLDIAQTQWEWFKNSGMINSDNLINDGLDDNCKNNGMQEWTYNQGVILGGLVELYKATNNASLLVEAQTIASAAISAKSRNGTLYEGCEPDCGGDGAQFKGIFMRNLRYLQNVAPQNSFKTFILNNANTIWANDRGNGSQLGVTWPGPYTSATAATQSSAIDALVAALAVA
ncbi:glycosyl hydrolase [Xylariales sp. AK1849]|nr:glycosyl hydrolase [Xylariales sp. AK1849]